MKYILLVHHPKDTFDAPKDPADVVAGRAYGAALHAAGVFVTGAGLESPQNATTVSVRLAPTIGAQVGRAVALAESGEVAAGLAALEAVAANRTANYQPWWAARAHLLRRLGRNAEARDAFERAASLTDDSALRAYLIEHATR